MGRLCLFSLLIIWPQQSLLADAFVNHNPPVFCEDQTRTYVRAGLFRKTSTNPREQIATYGNGSPMGYCELARKSYQDGVMCIPNSSGIILKRNVMTETTIETFGFGSAGMNACLASMAPELEMRPGYLQFMRSEALAAFKAKLPTISDSTVNAILTNPNTMWYDDHSMTFVYQDSEGDPIGLRSNRVGFDTGSRNSLPIRLLVNYFDPGTFKAPLGTAAGTGQVDNKFVINFWLPPRVDDVVQPVQYWTSTGNHHHWRFPIGTVLGEVLFLQGPEDMGWYVFEVRTRTRYEDGWAPDVFRPFATAASMADAITRLRPEWETGGLREVVQHLRNNNTLSAHTMATAPYDSIIEPISGYLDMLPPIPDANLVAELLTTTPFRSIEGQVWKRNETGETYGPSTASAFSVVPANYDMGVVQTNEVSCMRCHEHTSYKIGNIESELVLYGEIWGEDNIFTWHPFAVDRESFSVADNNRRISPRMVSAGLVVPRD